MNSISLKQNTKLFRERMTQAGFTLGGKDHAICPVMVNDAPVVPKVKARIRVQLSGSHTTEQVNRCVDLFIKIGREKSLIQ